MLRVAYFNDLNMCNAMMMQGFQPCQLQLLPWIIFLFQSEQAQNSSFLDPHVAQHLFVLVSLVLLLPRVALCSNAAAVTVTRVLPTVLPSSRCTLLALESRSFSLPSLYLTCDHHTPLSTPASCQFAFSNVLSCNIWNMDIRPFSFLYLIVIFHFRVW